jgi:hypothetical protein
MLERKRSGDHVRADIVQEVVNVERLTLLKYHSKPLEIGCIHNTSVVQSKELHRRNLLMKLARYFK